MTIDELLSLQRGTQFCWRPADGPIHNCIVTGNHGGRMEFRYVADGETSICQRSDDDVAEFAAWCQVV